MSFFWSGYVLRDFIFHGFNTKTYTGFIAIFVALLSLGILYEGMYLVKKGLLEKFLAIRRQTRIIAQIQRSEAAGNSYSEDVNINPRNSLINDERFNELYDNVGNPTVVSRCPQRREFSYLLAASFLHGVYVFVGYTIMNAVMTFNIWILTAVCSGIGLGYLFFRTEDNSLISDSDDFQRKTSIEAYAQLHDENDKTDDDDHAAAAGGRGTPGSRDRESTKQSPSGSGRTRNSSKASSSKSHRQGAPPTTEKEAPAGQVIVVGAQVHRDYQQSV